MLTGRRRKWASWLAVAVLLGLLLVLECCCASSGFTPGLSAQFCLNLHSRELIHKAVAAAAALQALT